MSYLAGDRSGGAESRGLRKCCYGGSGQVQPKTLQRLPIVERELRLGIECGFLLYMVCSWMLEPWLPILREELIRGRTMEPLQAGR